MSIIGICVGLAFFAGSVYAIWKDHEEKKAERAKWARIQQANLDSCERIWPTKSGPKGFDRQRRRA